MMLDWLSLALGLWRGPALQGLTDTSWSRAEAQRLEALRVDALEEKFEAALALGMDRLLLMRRIVLPQAMRVIIPPTGNETISMLKTSSLVYIATGNELFTRTEQIATATYAVIEMLIVASIWYLILTSVLTVGQYYIERHFARG